MNYKTQLIILSLFITVLMSLVVFCWFVLFLEDIHFGIIGVAIFVIPLGFLLFNNEFKVARREK